MAKKLPWFKWWPDDWLSDEKLRCCSLAAQGLWVAMLSLMHKNDRRGYLQVGGQPVNVQQLARMAGGGNPDEVRQLLAELINAGVPSVTDDGILYSRKMIREENKSLACSEAGRKGGGNPRIQDWGDAKGFVYAIHRESDGAIKIGASLDPKRRKKSGGGSFAGETTTLLRTWGVAAMGPAESCLHLFFKAKRIRGEWFDLDDSDLDLVEPHLAAAGHLTTFKGQSSAAHTNGLNSPLESGNGSESAFSFSRKENEGAGEGENRAPPKFDTSAPGLAQAWCFRYCGSASSQRNELRIADEFKEWIDKGVATREAIHAEINRKDRECSEPVWEMKARLTKKGSNSHDARGNLGSISRIRAPEGKYRGCTKTIGSKSPPAANGTGEGQGGPAGN